MKTIVLIAMLFAVAFSAILPEGEYRISCKVNPSNVLDIETTVNDNGANLIVSDWHSGNNQKFIIHPFSAAHPKYEMHHREWVTLVAKHSNKALTTAGSTSGSGYQQQPNTQSDEQLFRISRTSDGYYLIKNWATGYVLNCNSDAKSDINNRLAIQEGRDCSDAQKLSFERLDVVV